MGRQERVHECFEIGSPPLRQCVADLPFIVHPFSRELGAHRRQPFIEAQFEAFYFIIFGLEIIAWSCYSQQEGRTRDISTHSLKKAFAIWSMRMCG